MKYLINTYIINFRHHFVKTYINQVLYFNIIITSRNEDKHVVLKRQLESFIEDLKTMINDINLLLINELHNHLIVFDEIKVQYSLNLSQVNLSKNSFIHDFICHPTNSCSIRAFDWTNHSHSRLHRSFYYDYKSTLQL
jgi:hypothetical protein